MEKYNVTIQKRKKRKRKRSLEKWLIEFSKKVVLICVLLYIVVELFAMVVIWRYADTTAVAALISETSEVLRVGVFGYMIKAGIENWQKIRKNKNNDSNEESGAEG